MGYLVGVGVELHLGGAHSLVLEGGWRYLPIERKIVTSTSGSPAGDSVSQTDLNGELEYDDRDLGTNMSGTQMLVAYSFAFN